MKRCIKGRRQTKSEDTRIVDLGLDKSGRVKETKEGKGSVDDRIQVKQTYALAPTSSATPDVVDLVS